VIVLVVDENGILSLERERQTPIAIHPYGPMPGGVAFEQVKPPAGNIHVLWVGGGIELGKLTTQLRGVRWLNPGLAASSVVRLKPLVPD
jgi:hypothetical protein